MLLVVFKRTCDQKQVPETFQLACFQLDFWRAASVKLDELQTLLDLIAVRIVVMNNSLLVEFKIRILCNLFCNYFDVSFKVRERRFEKIVLSFKIFNHIGKCLEFWVVLRRIEGSLEQLCQDLYGQVTLLS